MPDAPSWDSDNASIQQQSAQQQALSNAYRSQVQGLGGDLYNQSTGLGNQLNSDTQHSIQNYMGAYNQANPAYQNQVGDLSRNFVSDTGHRYADQQQALKGVMDQYRQNAMTNLTSGQEGEALRQEYNRLGLLNSGAFNSALAQKFADVQQNSDLALMQQGLQSTEAQQSAAAQGFGAQNQAMGAGFQGYQNALGQGFNATNSSNQYGIGLQNQANQMGYAGQQQALQSGYDTQSQLGMAGLERQFGLEDQAYQSAMNAVLAKRQDQAATKQSIIGSYGQGMSGLLGSAGSIVGAFCFLEDTPVRMKDGSDKKIIDIDLGDETAGGTVVSVRQSLSSDLFTYGDVQVTGSHAVFDDGEWKRIKYCPKSVPVPGLFKVYSLVTSDHRIQVGQVTFADELEHDHYKTLQASNSDMDGSLEMLNKEMLIGRI